MLRRATGPHFIFFASVEDITEALWGSKVSPATISELNKKAYLHIEDWRNRPLRGGKYPNVYVNGIYLRRNWGGEYENAFGWTPPRIQKRSKKKPSP